MIIRPANLEFDHQDIIAGAKDFISRMDYTNFLPKTEEKLIFVINRILSLPGVEVTLAENNGAVVGGVGIFYGQHIWNPDILLADELFLWASKDAPKSTALRLLRSVMKDIKTRGALPAFKKLTSSPKGLESVYLLMGFRPVETLFMGSI